MSKTFRQFLEDIDVDDSAYSRHDADETVDNIQHHIRRNYFSKEGSDSSKWKKLPIKFPHEGFIVLYRKVHGSEFDIALVDTRDLSGYEVPVGFSLPKDKNRLVVNINTSKAIVTLKDNDFKEAKLYGLSTDVLSGAEKYRGSGMAPLLYQTMVEHGQVLFSSNTQTSGGQATWQRLTKTLLAKGYDVGVIWPSRSDPSHLISRYKSANVELLKNLETIGKDEDDINDALVIGSFDGMNEAAYDNYRSHWVVGPAGTLDRFKKFAIRVK